MELSDSHCTGTGVWFNLQSALNLIVSRIWGAIVYASPTGTLFETVIIEKTFMVWNIELEVQLGGLNRNFTVQILYGSFWTKTET